MQIPLSNHLWSWGGEGKGSGEGKARYMGVGMDKGLWSWEGSKVGEMMRKGRGNDGGRKGRGTESWRIGRRERGQGKGWYRMYRCHLVIVQKSDCLLTQFKPITDGYGTSRAANSYDFGGRHNFTGHLMIL